VHQVGYLPGIINTVSEVYRNKQISGGGLLMNRTSQAATRITNSSSNRPNSNANNELSSVGYSAANISYISLNAIICIAVTTWQCIEYAYVPRRLASRATFVTHFKDYKFLT
jgi:hypothetical protein